MLLFWVFDLLWWFHQQKEEELPSCFSPFPHPRRSLRLSWCCRKSFFLLRESVCVCDWEERSAAWMGWWRWHLLLSSSSSLSSSCSCCWFLVLAACCDCLCWHVQRRGARGHTFLVVYDTLISERDLSVTSLFNALVASTTRRKKKKKEFKDFSSDGARKAERSVDTSTLAMVD